jgi:hypothetical protein
MAFFFVCFMAMFFGRKVGWALCRSLLYGGPWVVCGTVCLVWAMGIAYGLRLLIVNMHPGWLLMIFAFAVATYIAIPNYGFFNESTIPDEGLPRHVFIKSVPMVAFIVFSIVFAFTIRRMS